MKNQIILEMKDLNKVYGKGINCHHALKDINLTVRQGEFVGIMGASGAGKSTLLNVAATIDRLTGGTVEIAGKNLSGLNERELADFRRDKLGFVFQDYNLIPSLTAGENIALPLVLAKEKTPQLIQKVGEIAGLLEIEKVLSQFPSTLSGGQKQRVSAARALVSSPALVLADEPTGALDSRSGKELLECFQRIRKQKNSTIIMVTHDCFSASYCDRVLIMKDGLLITEVKKEKRTGKEFMEYLSEQNLKLEAAGTEYQQLAVS